VTGRDDVVELAGLVAQLDTMATGLRRCAIAARRRRRRQLDARAFGVELALAAARTRLTRALS
jgi:hypothetical protein